MEILSNFCKLLISESEVVTKIINSPTIIVEAWLLFNLAVTILNIDYTTKKKNSYILLLSLSSIFTGIFFNEPINIMINYFIILLIMKLLFKLNWIKSLSSILIPVGIFALVGMFILKPFLIITKLSYYQVEYVPIYSLLYTFCVHTLTYIVLLILKKFKIPLLSLEILTSKDIKIIITNIFLGIFSICVQLIVTIFYTDTLPGIITFLSFISFLSYFFISLFSLIKTMKLQLTSNTLESAENYNATLTYLYDNVRAFKHDFDNMVFILGGFIDKNDIEGLKKYYKNLEKDCERVNNIALLNPEIINNSGIYNLLMAKYKKAEESKVELHLEFFFDFCKLKMPIYDFSRILGILLDNSIEAAKETKEKKVFIIIRDSQINNTQILNIKNSYSNKNIDISKIFEKGISEKENHSGIGLWEVNQILKRNNNAKLITNNGDKYFEQTLEIYY